MLPQQTEIVLGRHLSMKKREFSDAAKLFTLMRLQMQYNNHLIAEMKVKSPYMRDVERAAEVTSGSLTFLARYGLNRDEWKQLTVWADSMGIQLARGTKTYLNGLFMNQRFGEEINKSAFERSNDVELAKWVPFRRLDEQGTVLRMYKRQQWRKYGEMAKVVLAGTVAWGLVVQFMIQHEARFQGVPLDEGTQKILKDNVELQLANLADHYSIALGTLQEKARYFLKRKS